MRTQQELLATLSAQAALMRAHGPTMTWQAMRVLLCLAQRPKSTVKALADDVGLSQASISRNLMALGVEHRSGKAGLGMVETVADPAESRRSISYLTDKGRDFVKAMVAGKDAA